MFVSLGALEIVHVTSTPNDIIQDKLVDLECVFSGWPLPHIVLWHKDNELISNGTEGIYHTLQDKEEALYSILHLPHGREEQEGFYNCSAKNSIPGWSSSASHEIEMIYECKLCHLPLRRTVSGSSTMTRPFERAKFQCNLSKHLKSDDNDAATSRSAFRGALWCRRQVF